MNQVVIVRDPADAVAHAGPVNWAISQLRETLVAKGVACDESGGHDGLYIVVATPSAATAREMLAAAGVALPQAAEALAVVPGKHAGQPAVLACGADVRGLVYAVLELADRVACSSDALAALTGAPALAEQPTNPIRAVTRQFVSDIEDKPWFYDHDFWRKYLTMLVSQRFNRFHLGFGIGHDFLRYVVDAYFLFPYPFFAAVPGYDVRVVGLPDAERDRNLEMLRFISDEAAARGLDFQLGIWMQAYEWVDSPDANYTISGLNAENHAAYCRDALRLLIDACPGITGVTMRVHGESGVAEGNYDTWRTIFDGVVQSGRKIELDLHPKGVNQEMIQVALDTGMPVNLSPKYTAEHMGLPAHQAAIRELEIIREPHTGDHFVNQLMNLSGATLRFTRYGYADFLKRDRAYGVFYRIWPGTQRLLLWGDPALAAGYGRFGAFSGCLGVEIMEPLCFKGRRGSGLPGGRDAYADKSLQPAYDFEKYLYTYRLFGRLLYNPDAGPEQWQRYLRHEFGDAAPAVEEALASASRILPLVTTAHHPSAANNRFWPEMYSDMPIADESLPHGYRDTDEPRRFGNVSALDPALFSKIEEFADEVVQGKPSGRYSPLRVAAWLDGFANVAARRLADAEKAVAAPGRPEFRRLAVDVAVQSSLGRFFASKLRAGVGYALYLRNGDLGRLRQAVQSYQTARLAWLSIIETTRGVYRDDITVGGEPHLRGNWADRLPAIDGDLGFMVTTLEKAESAASAPAKQAAAALAPLASLDAEPPLLAYSHVPAADFDPGRPHEVELTVDAGQAISVRLHYRRVDQSERFQVVDMAQSGATYRAVIPADYTESPYALMYFFELRNQSGQAWFYPGFNATLDNQPYYVVEQQQ